MTIKFYEKGKDASPKNTVNHIRQCLEIVGLKCGHEVFQPEIEGCFSARIYLEGNLKNYIAANGKGTTEEFCLASGYAELMERIQNQIFLYQIKNGDSYSPYNEISSESTLFNFMTLEDLLSKEDSFLNLIIRKYANTIEDSFEDWSEEDMVLYQLRRIFPRWANDEIFTAPFYHIQSRCYESLPYELVKMLNLSNGMAAGNTIEEALVQGYSEICERYVQRYIIENLITPPDIDEKTLQQYPDISKFVNQIEESGPYRVLIKDGSLGRGFPVVCGIVINTAKQTFGVRLGAHPNMGLALERVFTEALQGRALAEFSQLNTIAFNHEKESSQQNIFNTQKVGIGYYPAQILSKTPSYPFESWNWKSEHTNRELTYEMTAMFEKENRQIYIQDVSYLGLPSVFIYVEGMSELTPCRYSLLKESRMKIFASQFLTILENPTHEQIKKVIVACKLLRNSVLENNITAMCYLPCSYPFPGGNDQIGFLMSVCLFYMGEYVEAARIMAECTKRADRESDSFCYLMGINKYMAGVANGVSIRLIKETMTKLYDEKTAKLVLEHFSDNTKIFEQLYPKCLNMQCDTCKNQGTICYYHELREFYAKIYKLFITNQEVTQRLHPLFYEYNKGSQSER